MSEDKEESNDKPQRLNLILEDYEVKLYDSFNSAVIFLPKEYWGEKVNVYKVK